MPPVLRLLAASANRARGRGADVEAVPRRRARRIGDAAQENSADVQLAPRARRVVVLAVGLTGGLAVGVVAESIDPEWVTVASGPLTLKSYGGPVSNDGVTIALKQAIGATDALRTGRYSKTLGVHAVDQHSVASLCPHGRAWRSSRRCSLPREAATCPVARWSSTRGTTGATAPTRSGSTARWTSGTACARRATRPGRRPPPGYTESRYNLAVAREVARILRADGAEVILTRRGDRGVGPCITRRAADRQRRGGRRRGVDPRRRRAVGRARVPRDPADPDRGSDGRHLRRLAPPRPDPPRRLRRADRVAAGDLRRRQRARRPLGPRRPAALGRAEGVHRDGQPAQRHRRSKVESTRFRKRIARGIADGLRAVS